MKRVPKFIERRINIYYDCWSPQYLRRQHKISCDMCCRRNYLIDCDHCEVARTYIRVLEQLCCSRPEDNFERMHKCNVQITKL